MKQIIYRRTEYWTECDCGYVTTGHYTFDRVSDLRNHFRRKDKEGFWCPECGRELFFDKRKRKGDNYIHQKEIIHPIGKLIRESGGF